MITMSFSNINPALTEDILILDDENLYLERKSRGAKISKIANEIIGMLNADGGTLVFGVSDNGVVEGVDRHTIAECEKIKYDYIKPTPRVDTEVVRINNNDVILFHISSDYENMFERKDNGYIFRRVGDENRGPLSNEAIDALRYDKSLRKFEDQYCYRFTYDDFDEGSLNEYKESLKYDGDVIDLLKARGLATVKNGDIAYKNSAVLLFGKDPNLWIPSSYVRYVRYKGNNESSGFSYNVVKDERFEGCILKLIPQIRDFLRASFDNYYYLDASKGIFEMMPEYPESAWIEGVVNALLHRSYNLQGNCIYIKHFDDKLEISNSGPLPAQVNINNIQNSRFSRNPKLGSVLYDMKYVRELNEGVKRIYESMKALNLSKPKYSDEDNIVTLTLENKLAKNRLSVSQDSMNRIMSRWSSLHSTQQQIIAYIFAHRAATVEDLAVDTGLTTRTIRDNLNKLVSEDIIFKDSDRLRDKNAKYVIVGK